MSYEVIYDTIIVDCGDKYMEVSKQCSNNVFPKPAKNEYMAVIKSKENYIDLVNAYMQNTDDWWTVKVNSRYLTTKQFGEYLNRKVKKAISFDEFMDMATIQKYEINENEYGYYGYYKILKTIDEVINALTNEPYSVAIFVYKNRRNTK